MVGDLTEAKDGCMLGEWTDVAPDDCTCSCSCSARVEKRHDTLCLAILLLDVLRKYRPHRLGQSQRSWGGRSIASRLLRLSRHRLSPVWIVPFSSWETSRSCICESDTPLHSEANCRR